MTLKLKIALRGMTAMELVRGRYMRAPDHPGGDGSTGDSSGAEGEQGTGKADEGTELTTEQQLEKEFGQDITPATDNDDTDSSTGEEEESAEGSDEEDDGESDTEDKEESKEDEEAEQPKKEPEKPKGRAQERFDELTARARQSERDADYWKRRAEELGAKPADAAGEEPTFPSEPEADKYQYGEADLDYIRDRAKYEAKVEVLEEQAQARFKSESAALEGKWSTTLAANVEKYPDYDEKVIKSAERGDWKCSPIIAVGIKDSEYGVDISYELATNPTEADRISRLTPLEQAREFGQIEGRYKQSSRIKELESEVAKLKGKAAENKGPAPTIVSKAPVPPKRHVRGGGGVSQVSADTDDFAAFERMADMKMHKNQG